MKIYFVRHGESQGNAQSIHQLDDSPLSDIGESQAKLLAHRFHTITIEALLSSPITRAHQTAKEISRVTQKPVAVVDLFREFSRPPEVIGLSRNHPFALEVDSQVLTHIDEPDWHYSTEENWYDVANRADEALRYLSNRNEKNVTVVSHSGFIKMLLWRIVQPKQFQASRYFDFRQKLKISNTGISVCEYSSDSWQVLTINDDAHLG